MHKPGFLPAQAAEIRRETLLKDLQPAALQQAAQDLVRIG